MYRIPNYTDSAHTDVPARGTLSEGHTTKKAWNVPLRHHTPADAVG